MRAMCTQDSLVPALLKRLFCAWCGHVACGHVVEVFEAFVRLSAGTSLAPPSLGVRR